MHHMHCAAQFVPKSLNWSACNTVNNKLFTTCYAVHILNPTAVLVISSILHCWGSVATSHSTLKRQTWGDQQVMICITSPSICSSVNWQSKLTCSKQSFHKSLHAASLQLHSGTCACECLPLCGHTYCILYTNKPICGTQPKSSIKIDMTHLGIHCGTCNSHYACLILYKYSHYEQFSTSDS